MNILLRLILFICLVFAGQCYATTAISYGYVANTVQSCAENLNNNGLINPSDCCRKAPARDSIDSARDGSFFVSLVDFVVPKSTSSLPEGVDPYQLELFPPEHYQRVKHYGNTPTAAQKASVPEGMEFDHDPMLVKHYYEGTGNGDLPGYNLTPAERKAFGARLDTGGPATPAQQRAQGAAAAKYSKEQKKIWALDQKENK